MNDTDPIRACWQAYLDALPAGAQRPQAYQAWYFCDNEESANALGALVVAGIKTGTASLVWEYEAEDEQLPQAGDLSIITDWAGRPLCIIETTAIEVKPFYAVDADHAHAEGEGDRSLAYWRAAHWDYFSRTCGAIGRAPAETMPVVCERFRVVFGAAR